MLKVLFIAGWFVAGFMQTPMVNAEEGKLDSPDCPFGVCMGASISDFRQKVNKDKECEGRMCLVHDVPSPNKSFKEYSVVFTDEGKACAVVASAQFKSRRKVLEQWSYDAMYYNVKYGTVRAFDEKTMTTIWTQFEEGVNEDIIQVILTIGKERGVYLLTDLTRFKNAGECQ